MVINSFPQREETLRKRRRLRRIKYGVFLLLCLIVLGLISYLSYRPKVRVTEISLSGGVLVTEKDIQKETEKYLEGSYFWIFPKNNSFIYPKEDLKKHLKQNFQRIDTIKIELEGLSKMIVSITERKPIAVWCDSLSADSVLEKIEEKLATASTTPEKTSLDEVVNVSEVFVDVPPVKLNDNSPKCYFLDQNSTIFAEAPNFSGDAYFKYYGLVEKNSPIGKEYMASSSEFNQINDFISATKQLSIKPIYLVAKGEGEFSLVLYGGGEVYFDVKKSLKSTYQNLETLLKSSELSFKQGYLPIEYIDLRYGNKLFYKIKAQ